MISYGPFKDQINTHKRRYYTQTENNTLPQQTISGEDWMDLTPVAGPIFDGGHLSQNLQARFCKLYPADFSIAIYLFVCS